MSKSIKSFVAIGLFALLAACGAPQQDEVMADPVVEEPTFNKL